MTLYELTRRSLEPFLPPIYSHVRRRIVNELATRGGNVSILDVGGRKSSYTIGVPAKVTIIDLPRDSKMQNTLNPGIDDSVAASLKKHRSNVDNLFWAI